MKRLGATGSLPARAGGRRLSRVRTGRQAARGTQMPSDRRLSLRERTSFAERKTAICPREVLPPLPRTRGERAGVRGDTMPRENLIILQTS